MNKMEKNKFIDGFLYDPEERYLMISDGNVNKPLQINTNVISNVLEIMKRNDIKRLAFGDPFMNLKDISFLKDFEFLNGLRIALEDFDIDSIKYCIDVEELIIAFDYKGDFDFEIFKNLKSLSIVWKNESSKSIFKCDKLNVLDVSKYKGLTLQDFSVYENTLEKLYLREAKIETFSGVEHLKSLKELHIVGLRNLKSIKGIENCSNLEKVFIHGCKKIEDLHCLGNIKKLKVLNLDNLGTISTIEYLASAKTLQEFYMSESTNVLDGNLNILDELRSNYNLGKIIFRNRRHYSHKAEELGYKAPLSVANLFSKNKGI